MKTRITGILLGAALALAPISAMAADSAAQQGPLAPGEAAGVEKASDWSWDHNRTAYLIGGAVVVAAVIIIASDNGNGHHTSATSTH
ncbi:MAG TPA: hypothetical protein VGH02_13495 [Rhizomicrobium sp.]|jgi:hypothetical protein